MRTNSNLASEVNEDPYTHLNIREHDSPKETVYYNTTPDKSYTPLDIKRVEPTTDVNYYNTLPDNLYQEIPTS